jgi:hypothetical protein
VKGNPHPPCPDCAVRHHPDRDCRPQPVDGDIESQLTAAGAGDGVYHDAPYLKKFGA